MKYDFIDIGTSDFDYTVPKNSEYGIYIEPIKFYLDKIPNYANTIKLNVAISNDNCISKIYYLSTNFIKKNKLPSYLKGCNKINDIHPTIIRECNKKNINYIDNILIEEIKCITLKNVINQYNINHICMLKIDTEGNDSDIVKQALCLQNQGIIINKIIFENNELSDKKSINQILNFLSCNNWKVTLKYKRYNVLCEYIGDHQ